MLDTKVRTAMSFWCYIVQMIQINHFEFVSRDLILLLQITVSLNHLELHVRFVATFSCNL